MLGGYEIFLEVAWILHRIPVTALQDYLRGSSSAHLLAWRISLGLFSARSYGAGFLIFIFVFVAVVVNGILCFICYYF